MQVLNGFSHIEAWRARWRALGALPRHERHLLRTWTQALPLSRPRRQADQFLPRALREDWPEAEQMLASLATLQSAHPAEDGGQRLLVRLADGQTVESVLLPRGGLCVSTQLGCAVGCVFCMTGQGGLLRQLGSAEIVAQVALARRLRAVNKVVFMGMGEPAHNLDAVMEAIELLGTAGAIAHKNLVFSTVGDARVFERLPQGPVKPALALSLHSCDEARRAQLLPRAPRMPVDLLLAQADAYARATGYPVQVQWTLLAGVNDGPDELEALALGLKGRHMMLNLIPMNAVDGVPWQRPAHEHAVAMTRELNRRGVLTRLRQSAAQDVEGGCGQLRARQASGLQTVALPLPRKPVQASPAA
ncbi:MAG: RNA methyltransferase [Rubrivivax sp.]|nr:RNA methyltransferase [Rubrivivax sp.]